MKPGKIGWQQFNFNKKNVFFQSFKDKNDPVQKIFKLNLIIFKVKICFKKKVKIKSISIEKNY